MPRRLSDSECDIFENFIGDVLRRVEAGRFTAVEGQEAIMRPLTAYLDERGSVEFIPWMTTRIGEWNSEDGDQA